jgi:hypothetical protein
MHYHATEHLIQQLLAQPWQNLLRQHAERFRALQEAQFPAIYWDFEAFLAAVGSALDVLARLVGLAYKDQTPPSFSKLCAKNYIDGPVVVLRQAKEHWVSKLKDDRDCFVHYTPVDTLLSVAAVRYTDGWEIRCKLPTNPNARDILGFRYSRRAELLRYSMAVYKSLWALDKKVAKQLLGLFGQGQFPQRTRQLFFVGRRVKQ